LGCMQAQQRVGVAVVGHCRHRCRLPQVVGAGRRVLRCAALRV
jgi:hypothetical protein